MLPATLASLHGSLRCEPLFPRLSVRIQQRSALSVTANPAHQLQVQHCLLFDAKARVHLHIVQGLEVSS